MDDLPNSPNFPTIQYTMLKPLKEYYQNKYKYIATILMKALSQVCMKYSMKEICKQTTRHM